MPSSQSYTVNEDGRFYYAGRLLEGARHERLARRIVDALPKAERTLYICASPVSGAALDFLLETMHPTSALLALEAENPLFEHAKRVIPTEVIKNKRFCLAFLQKNGDFFPFEGWTAEKKAQFLETRSFRRVVRFNLTGGSALNEDLYAKIEERFVRGVVQDWGNAATLIKLGRRYALNFLRNLALLDKYPSVSEFRISQNDIAVLGAGPSLDDFFADGAQKDSALVAVDTALPVLAARKEKAALAVALEAQHWNLRDFLGVRHALDALAMDLSSLPRTHSALSCPVYLFWTPWSPLRFFDYLRTQKIMPLEMPPLGNVGITSYALARILAPSASVTTAGLDFCFTLDSYHCRESPGHKRALARQSRFQSVLPCDATLQNAAFQIDGGKRQDAVMRSYKTLFDEVKKTPVLTASAPTAPKTASVRPVLQKIRGDFCAIRAMLTGEAKLDEAALFGLLKDNDILYAHFPEYAGTEKQPAVSDISFLKRIRAEIDFFIKACALKIDIRVNF